MLLEEISTYLQGNADLTGWSTFLSFLPDTPDKAISIVEVGGDTPDTTVAYEKPWFDVLVRGDEFGYDACETMMETIYDTLHNADISGYAYCQTRGNVIPMGYDKKNRPTLLLGFRTMRYRG